MSTVEEKRQNEPAEIDIMYIFRPITRGLSRMGRSFSKTVSIIAKNKWIFIAIFLLTVATGYAIRFFVPKSFQTEAVFVTHNLPGEVSSVLINNVDKYAGDSFNADMLANLLNISVTAAETIQSVKLEPISDTLLIDKQDMRVSLFKIILRNTDTSVLAGIQNGLVNLLENNNYSLKRKQARIRSMQELESGLQLRMQSMDSLKHLVNSSIIPRSSGQGIILGQPINPVDVYNAELSYYKEKLRTEAELSTIDNIEVIQPFLKLNKFNFPNFKMLLLLFTVGGFLLAFIITPIIGKK